MRVRQVTAPKASPHNNARRRTKVGLKPLTTWLSGMNVAPRAFEEETWSQAKSIHEFAFCRIPRVVFCKNVQEPLRLSRRGDDRGLRSPVTSESVGPPTARLATSCPMVPVSGSARSLIPSSLTQSSSRPPVATFFTLRVMWTSRALPCWATLRSTILPSNMTSSSPSGMSCAVAIFFDGISSWYLESVMPLWALERSSRRESGAHDGRPKSVASASEFMST